MNGEMTLGRFETLAGSYGGDVRRWPLAERQAAERALLSRPLETQSLLAAACALDDILAAAPAPVPDNALRERIIRAWPKSPRLTPRWRWLIGIGIGAGLAGAAGAGLAATMVLAPATLFSQAPPAVADSITQASVLLSDSSELAEG